MERDESHHIYLTKEQAARIAALAIDSLVGVQISTNAHTNTIALVDMVPIDNCNNSRHFTVFSDGSYNETT